MARRAPRWGTNFGSILAPFWGPFWDPFWDPFWPPFWPPFGSSFGPVFKRPRDTANPDLTVPVGQTEKSARGGAGGGTHRRHRRGRGEGGGRAERSRRGGLCGTRAGGAREAVTYPVDGRSPPHSNK